MFDTFFIINDVRELIHQNIFKKNIGKFLTEKPNKKCLLQKIATFKRYYNDENLMQ